MRNLKIYFLLLVMPCFVFNLKAQDKVTFESSDDVIVTAMLYKASDSMPYIVMCHDINSSKGEYRHIVKKFMKLGYNCLAVDLRNGNTFDSVTNETATLVRLRQMHVGNAEVQLDMVAAINYAHSLNSKRVILMGSGYSASLALYIGAANPNVAAVVAYSPTDYFGGSLKTKDVFVKYQPIPVYVASSKAEAEDAKKYVAAIPANKVTLYTPTGAGDHGSGALMPYDADFHSYWISLLLFLKSVK